MLGQYQPLSTYQLPSAPSVWLKQLWKASAAAPLRAGMKYVSFPFLCVRERAPFPLLRNIKLIRLNESLVLIRRLNQLAPFNWQLAN
jgi:hypothetical protein